MEIKSICFEETKKEFEEYLLALGYSKVTVACYQRTMSWLEKFILSLGETTYTAGTGETFLNNELKEGRSACSLKATRLVMRRLDDFVKGTYSLRVSKEYSVPDCFSKDFNA